MQSTTFNPVQLLAEVSSNSKTGTLNVRTATAAWNLFFIKGEWVYAENSLRSLGQLQYFLLKHAWKEAASELNAIAKSQPIPSNTEEMSPAISQFENAISKLCADGYLDEPKIERLVDDMSQDVLESFLWIREGESQWDDAAPLPPWFQSAVNPPKNLDLPSIVRSLQQRLLGWSQCAQQIQSPYQRPYLLDFQDINKTVPNGTLSPHTLSKLSELMRRGLSLRQLSLYLKQDELQIAYKISPYVQHKVIHFRNPQQPFDQLPFIPKVQLKTSATNKASQRLFKIACIDDSPTVLLEMKRSLDEKHFEVTTIDNPVKASATIFRLKPDLILMDITMPQMNGYKLCSLLRSSAVFDETPIIMVSGNTGLIDKARAKMSGATDYLTKPFKHSELKSIVNKYLSIKPVTST